MMYDNSRREKLCRCGDDIMDIYSIKHHRESIRAIGKISKIQS